MHSVMDKVCYYPFNYSNLVSWHYRPPHFLDESSWSFCWAACPCRSQVLRRSLWVRSLTQASNFEEGGLLPDAAFLHTSDSLACFQGCQITWFHPFISMFRSPSCWKLCTSILNLLCFRLSSALCYSQILFFVKSMALFWKTILFRILLPLSIVLYFFLKDNLFI